MLKYRKLKLKLKVEDFMFKPLKITDSFETNIQRCKSLGKLFRV